MIEYNITHPLIEGVSFKGSHFYADNNQIEGKFVVYKKDKSLKLYGLLWSHNFEDVGRVGGYWYDFDMDKVNYIDIPLWCYRVRHQYPFIKETFEDLFPSNSIIIGGGFLTKDNYKGLLKTFQDNNIDKVPEDIIKGSLI